MVRIRREAEVLTNLDHPYIVNLQEVFETSKYVCIVMEYAAGGDLFHYIVKQPNHRLEVVPSHLRHCRCPHSRRPSSTKHCASCDR